MTRYILGLLFLLPVSTVPAQSTVARVGDVTRLQGQGTNVLVGYGLVTGLDGTGDGAKFLHTMRALSQMMKRFNAQVESLDEIDSTKNVAIVMLEVIIPEHGAREGDLLDVSVSAIAAKSLEGGRLMTTPLLYGNPGLQDLYGFAQGRITLGGPTATSGRIRHGARMERDVLINVVASGATLATVGFMSEWIKPGEQYITLVLDEPHATWSMAAAVAQAVDKELSISADVNRVALAMDSKNVVVLLPKHQRGDPASWIRDVEQTPILLESGEARVTINRQTGTIVITGDTKLSPVIVSQKGMTITVATPLPDGSIVEPAFERHDFVALDVRQQRTPNVRDLLEALNRLKVPFEDRVSILQEIHRAGKLHARILYEG